MKLVIVWSISDACTYWAEIVQPVEYSSVSDFFNDFLDWSTKNPDPVVYAGAGFAGTDLDATIEDFEVYELEEWFEKFRPQQ
jgi:hypothetical protein